MLIARDADFLLEQWQTEAAQGNADPTYCLALQLFSLAAAGEQAAIAEQLQAAERDEYLGRLHDFIGCVAEKLMIFRELPWTPAYHSLEAFAAAVKGIPGLSQPNCKRMLADNRLQKRSTLGGTQYRAADPELQRQILSRIRENRQENPELDR